MRDRAVIKSRARLQRSCVDLLEHQLIKVDQTGPRDERSHTLALSVIVLNLRIGVPQAEVIDIGARERA